jgi:hypothetical protein
MDNSNNNSTVDGSSNRSSVQDEEVVDSFLYEVQYGSLADYLAHANIAVCVGNTLFFCHGAVDRDTMQYVPHVQHTKFHKPISPPIPGAMIDHVPTWTTALNVFLQQGLQDYHQQPYYDYHDDADDNHHDDENNNSSKDRRHRHRRRRGGEYLMAIQNRPAVWGRSIVSNCYGDGGGITSSAAAQRRNDPQRIVQSQTDPLAFEKVCSDPADPVVAAWLRKDGIQRVIVGHKPTGDCPAVLSALYTGVEVVSADTSFSDVSAADNRGQALAVTVLTGTSPTDNQLELRGTLRDGRSLHTTTKHVRLHPNGIDTTVGDVYLGTQLLPSRNSNIDTDKHPNENNNDGGWWVKGIVNNDDETSGDILYYLTRGNGRQVEFTTMKPHQVTTKCNVQVVKKISVDVALN